MDPYLRSDLPFQFSVNPGIETRAPLDTQYLRESDISFNNSPKAAHTQELNEKISRISFVINHPGEESDLEKKASHLFRILSNLISEHPSHAELAALIPILKTQREAIDKLLETGYTDKDNLLKELSLSLGDLKAWVEHVKQYEAESNKLSDALSACFNVKNPQIEGEEQEIRAAQTDKRLRVLEVPPWETATQGLYNCAKIWKENLSKTTPHAEVFAEELSLRFIQDLKEANLPFETLGLYEEMLGETLFLQNEITRLANITSKSNAETKALSKAVAQLETVQLQVVKARGEVGKVCEGLNSILKLLPEEKKATGLFEKVYSYLVTSGTPHAELRAQLKLIESTFSSFDSLLKRVKSIDRKGITANAVTEEERQELSLKRPKLERSWWGKLWHPEEWSDTTKNILKVGFATLQVTAQAQKTYQQVSSATQTQTACKTLSLANKVLPQEALNEIGNQLLREWHERGGYQTSSATATSQELTDPATRHYEGTQSEWNWFQINRGVKLVEQYCKEHHFHLPEDAGILFSGPNEVIIPPPSGEEEHIALERFINTMSTYPVDDRLLLHVVGDLYGQESGFEGSTVDANWNYRLAILKERVRALKESPEEDKEVFLKEFFGESFIPTAPKLSTLQNLEKKIERALSLWQEFEASPEQFATAFRTQVEKAAEEKDSFFLPLRWPRHAIAMEVIPEESGSWTVRIYNTGQGLQFHSKVVVGSETFHLPSTEHKQVSTEALLDPLFLKALRDMGFSQDKSVGPNTLYYAIADLLKIRKGAPLESAKASTLLQKPQRSGTCAFQVMNAVFLSYFGSQPAFDRFHWEEQLTTLVTYFNGQKALWSTKEDSFRNFKQGVVEFAALTRRLSEEGLLREKVSSFALDKIRVMEQELEVVEEQFAAGQLYKAAVTIVAQPAGTFLLQPPPVASIKKSEIKVIEPASLGSFFWQENPVASSPASLQGDLHSLVDLLTPASQRKEHEAVHRAIQKQILSLPHVEDPFWSDIPQEQVEGVIGDLSSLNALFIETLSHLGSKEEIREWDLEPLDFLTPFKMVALADRLGQRVRIPGVEIPNLYDPIFKKILEGTKTYGGDYQKKADVMEVMDPLAAAEILSLKTYWAGRAHKEVPFFSSSRGILSNQRGIYVDLQFLEIRDLPSIKWIREFFDQKGISLNEIECLKAFWSPREGVDGLPLIFYQLKNFYFSLYQIMSYGNTGTRVSAMRPLKVQLPPERLDDMYAEEGPIELIPIVSGHCSEHSFYAFSENAKYSPLYEKSVSDIFCTSDIVLDSHSVMNGKSELARFASLLKSYPSERIWNTLAFFSTHSPLLFKGASDAGPRSLQSLLRQLLFHSSLLLEEFLVSPSHSTKLVGAISGLLERLLKEAERTGKPLNQLFVLRLNRQVENFLTFVKERHPEAFGDSSHALPFDTRQEIDRLLGRDSLSRENRLLLLVEKGATFLYRKPEGEKELTNLIEAHLALSMINPHTLSEGDYKDFYSRSALELRRAYQENLPSIKRLLETSRMSEVLSTIMKTLFPQLPSFHWTPHNDFPLFVAQEERYLLNLLTGTLYHEGRAISYPSYGVREEKFVLASGGQEVVLYRELSDDLFEVHTEKGDKYRIVEHKYNKFSIYKRIGDQWALFIEPTKDHLPEPLIRTSWRYWDIPGQGLLIEEKTGNPRYLVVYETETPLEPFPSGTKEAKVYEVDAFRQLTGTVLDPIQESSSLSFLSRIEDPKQLLFWRDEKSGDPLRLEIPRMKLSFTFEKRKEEFVAVCKELRGVEIAKNQAVKGLGDATNYLVLTESDKEFLLFSEGAFVPTKSTLTTETALASPASSETIVPYWLFDLGEQGELIPRQEAGRLYLSMLNLWEHSYPEAITHLRRHRESLAPHTPEEIRLLERILGFGGGGDLDSSPMANFVRLQAALILLVRSYDFDQKYRCSEGEAIKLVHFYFQYLEDHTRLSPYELLPQEEQLFLHLLLKMKQPNSEEPALKEKSIVGRIATRLSQLKGEEGTFGEGSPLYTSPPLFQFNELMNRHEGKPSLLRPVIDREILSDALTSLRNQDTPHQRRVMEKIFGNELPSSADFGVLMRFAARIHAEDPKKRDPFLYLLALYEQKLTPPDKQQDRWGFELFTFNPPLKDHAKGIISSRWVSEVLGSDNISYKVVPKEKKEVKKSAFEPSCLAFDTLSESEFALLNSSAFLTGEEKEVHSLEAASELSALFSLQTGDSVANRLFQTTARNIEVHANKRVKQFSITDPEALGEAFISLESDFISTHIAVRRLKDSIETLLRKEVRDRQGVEKQFSISAETEALPSVDDAIRLFLKRDDASILERNPALTIEEAFILIQQVHDYLALSTKMQRIEKLLGLLQELKSEGTSQDLLNRLGEEWERKPSYSVIEHPEYLVFEYYLGITLWPKQVDGLEALHISRGKIGEPKQLGKALELLMGSGKTHVILPLLAEMLADGTALPVLIIPEPLVPTMSRELDERMWKGFGKELERIQVERSTPLDLDRLERIQERLSNALTRRAPVMMSDSDIHSLFLSFLETALEAHLGGVDQRDHLREITLYRKIFTLLKGSGIAVIDEVDSVLTVLHSHHFTVGGKQPLLPSMLKGSLSVYLALLSITGGRVSGISKEEYVDRVRPFLIEKLLDPTLYRNKELNNFFSTLNSEQKGWIREFLENEPSSQADQFIETILPEIQDTLSIMREEVNQLLPLTLAKNPFNQYGPIPKEEEKTIDTPLMAMPYHLGQPVSGSSFGTELEIINYAIQYCLRHSMKELIDKEVTTLARHYRDLQENDLETIEDLKEQLQMLLGVPTDPSVLMDEQTVKVRAQQFVATDPASALELIQKHVLFRLRNHPQQISSTPQLYGSLFSKHLGMTGTFWNIESLPRLFESVTPSDTEEKTLNLLWAKSPHAVDVVGGKDLVASLYEGGFEGSVIDAAGILAEQDPLEVAKKMLEGSPSVGGVVFYDTHNRACILERGEIFPKPLSVSRLPKEKRACFWDLSHTTGSDVRLGINAKAKFIFGKHVGLRDLSQAAWRLRQLDKGQTVSFAIPQEDERVIRQVLEQAMKRPVEETLELKHLLLYAAYNQAMRVGDHNFRSFRQQLSGHLLAQLFPLLGDTTVSNEELVRVLNGAKELFFEETTTRPYHQFGRKKTIDLPKEKRVEEALQITLEGSAFTFLRTDPFMQKRVDSNALRMELERVAARALPFLNTTISGVQAAGYGRSREVQREVDKETEKELEKEKRKEIAEIGLLPREDLLQWAKKGVFQRDYWENRIPEENITAQPKELFSKLPLELNAFFSIWKESSAPHYSSHLLASPNLVPLHLHPNNRARPYAPSQQYPMSLLLMRDKETGTLEAMLLNVEDEMQFRAQLRSDGKAPQAGKRELQLALYDFTGRITEEGSEPFPIKEVAANPEFLLLNAQAKFFGGLSSYSVAELSLLEKWIVENGPIKMQSYFEGTILDGRDAFSRHEYEASSLHRLFRKLR